MPVRTITHEGRTDTISGWAETIGITHEAIVQRLRRGWSEAEAVTARNSCRAPNRAKRIRARARAKAETTSVVATPFDELKRQNLAAQRQFNSILRQFNRDLHAIMGRGVGLVLVETSNDRSTPVTRGLS